MVNEQAIVEAFGKIREDFQLLRKEIKEIKEKISILEDSVSYEETPKTEKIVEDGDLADSYY